MSMKDIKQILQFHKQKPLNEKYFDKRETNIKDRKFEAEPLWLASDMQEPELMSKWINKFGAITLNGKLLPTLYNKNNNEYFYWSKADKLSQIHNKFGEIVEIQYYKYLKLYIKHYKEKKNEIKYKNFVNKRIEQFDKFYNKDNKHDWNRMFWYKTSGHNFWEKESIIFDMWMVTNSKFFIGSWFSTCTRTICHWRGFNRIYNSSNCYIKHKWELLNKKSGKIKDENLWFDISVIDKPLISWARK